MRLKEQGKKSPGKWSVCLSCGKRLKTSENIPIFSWLVQKGKCKNCGAKIGHAEFFSEFSLALAMTALANVLFDRFTAPLSSGTVAFGAVSASGSQALSGLFNLAPSQIPNLLVLIGEALVLIVSITMMWILAIYDAKWQKLPTFLLTILNACAIIHVILQIVGLILNSATNSGIDSSVNIGGLPQLISQSTPAISSYLLSLLSSAALLAGPYLLLSVLSREKLVGSGDWLIALPLALFLGNWWLALVALFLANFAGSVYGLSSRAKAKAKAKAKTEKATQKIPFGPFLIFAFVVVYSLQAWFWGLIASGYLLLA